MTVVPLHPGESPDRCICGHRRAAHVHAHRPERSECIACPCPVFIEPQHHHLVPVARLSGCALWTVAAIATVAVALWVVVGVAILRH